MFLLNENEKALKQKTIYDFCLQEINKLLLFGEELFATLFPNATIITQKGEKAAKWPADAVIEFKHDKIKDWVCRILDEAIYTSQGKEYELPFDTPIIPTAIGNTLLESCLKILTCGRDLTDLDYVFISEIATAVRMDPGEVYGRIEQTLYRVRKDSFLRLKPLLSKKQRLFCAGLLLKAIEADRMLHPAEIKYFEIISDLLDNKQADIEQIKTESEQLDVRFASEFPKEIAEFLFRYLVEIVMCDKQFDPDESQFIKDMGEAFDLNHQRQDEILQPVVAAVMVKSDLFW